MSKEKDKYEALKLKNQLCFPLYAASNAILRKYKPFLNKLDLTYTQYITMMVLWEKEYITYKELEEYLCLGSSTLTPVLNRLETKGYVERYRLEEDARNVIVMISEKGEELKKEAVKIPREIAKEFKLEQEEATELYRILYKLIESD